jgi:hypothetical protein
MTTTNYPYLAGYLEALLKGLPYDLAYVNAQTADERYEIVTKKIKLAHNMTQLRNVVDALHNDVN